MNIILSIKPKYVEKILNSSKGYEFRKNIYKQKINRIYIYSSSPVQKIVASFKPSQVIHSSPSNIWKTCKHQAGINYNEFMNYFENRDAGYAIKIDDLQIFKDPIAPKEIIKDFVPPQSFKYLNTSLE